MTQVGSSGVNADAYWIDQASGLYVVADGASGAHDKQFASRCCVETFESLKGQLSQMAPEDFLKRCFIEVNRRLIEQSQKDGAVSFTTLSAALHFDNLLYVLSVGDSPIYGVTPEGLQTLSKPIKRYSKLIELGILTEEEITANIEQLRPELRSAFEIFLPAIVLPLQVTTYWAKDYTHLILCTDGLSDHLSDQEWLHITDEKASLTQTAEAYIQRVEEKCATTYTDDMTAILVSL